MLLSYLNKGVVEAGCDEAGRGCLAGPVFAAAVILPPDFENELLNDSKKLTEKQRYALRPIIEKEAIAWAVGVCDNKEIDKMNILKCSIEAMHRAVRALKVRPEALLIDGNRFYPFEDILLNGPEDYDFVLTQMYGDYMTPPPESERDHHHIELLG